MCRALEVSAWTFCPNGHSACRACASGLRSCPLCPAGAGVQCLQEPIRNVALEAIQESVLGCKVGDQDAIAAACERCAELEGEIGALGRELQKEQDKPAERMVEAMRERLAADELLLCDLVIMRRGAEHRKQTPDVALPLPESKPVSKLSPAKTIAKRRRERSICTEYWVDHCENAKCSFIPGHEGPCSFMVVEGKRGGRK